VVGSVHERDYLSTLVERSAASALVAKLPHGTTMVVNRATLRLIRESGLPLKTITWDNGTGLHGYKALEAATGIHCYLAYPHRPWQRGSNGNFNGLLRQYFPKRRSIAWLQQNTCDQVAHELDSRPRKRDGYGSPIEKLRQLLAVLRLEC